MEPSNTTKILTARHIADIYKDFIPDSMYEKTIDQIEAIVEITDYEIQSIEIDRLVSELEDLFS
jgi:transcription-repair coupling factor (superfamily II helicase)